MARDDGRRGYDNDKNERELTLGGELY